MPPEVMKAFFWYDYVTRAVMPFYEEFKQYLSPKRWKAGRAASSWSRIERSAFAERLNCPWKKVST
jgi:hypothetical protein